MNDFISLVNSYQSILTEFTNIHFIITFIDEEIVLTFIDFSGKVNIINFNLSLNTDPKLYLIAVTFCIFLLQQKFKTQDKNVLYLDDVLNLLSTNRLKKFNFKDTIYGFTYIPEELNFETVKDYHDYVIKALGWKDSFLDNIV